MNDGHEEKTIDKDGDFGLSVARSAVMQICETAGFHCSKQSALNYLTETTIALLHDIGKLAHVSANSSGRTQCNLIDIVRGFEQLQPLKRLTNQSCSSTSIINMAKEGSKFLNSSNEVPFATPIPRFPVLRNHERIPSFSSMNEKPPGGHIPPWLPALPDLHTHKQTPVWNDRNADHRSQWIEQARFKRKAEMAFLNLHKRLLNAAKGASSSAVTSTDTEDLEEGKSALPSTAHSLCQQDALILENHPSVIEVFRPIIEATKEKGIEINSSSKKDLHPNIESPAKLKCKFNKNILDEDSSLNCVRKNEGKKVQWKVRNGERDDKKRRAELILRQFME